MACTSLAAPLSAAQDMVDDAVPGVVNADEVRQRRGDNRKQGFAHMGDGRERRRLVDLAGREARAERAEGNKTDPKLLSVGRISASRPLLPSIRFCMFPSVFTGGVLGDRGRFRRVWDQWATMRPWPRCFAPLSSR